jgi:hypothetical protein
MLVYRKSRTKKYITGRVACLSSEENNVQLPSLEQDPAQKHLSSGA